MSEQQISSESREFVPWTQGAEILNLKRGAFFYLVQTGQVRAEPDRGARNGRYSLEDILKIKQEREAGKQRRPYRLKPKPVLLDWLSPADIPACLKLDYAIYHEIDYDTPRTYQERQKKNGHIAMAAFNKDRSECLGYVGLIPLPEQMCLDIVTGKHSEVGIPLEVVETYDRPGGFSLLATSAAIHPERPDLLYKLLYKIMEFWLEQFPERYITRIYAQTISTRGDLLVQHFFMTPLPAPYPTDAYYLDMARPSASKIIRWFQGQIHEKARVLSIDLPTMLTTRYTPPFPSN